MSDLTQAAVLMAVLFLMLGLGVWVALALLGCGLAGLMLFTSAPACCSPPPRGAPPRAGR